MFVVAFCCLSAAFGQSFEQRMIDAGLVNIRDLDSTIMVDLRYSTTDNFIGIDAYGDLKNAYMLPYMAARLVKVQQQLAKKGYCLKVWDAARPISVQRTMWKLVEGTANQIYVANPARGGMHNYGAAVDVTIVKIDTGKDGDMGSPFDHFGVEAWVTPQASTPEREILLFAMAAAQLRVYSKEWWHYEMAEYTAPEIRAKYSLLDF